MSQLNLLDCMATDENLQAFLKIRDELIRSHHGKVVVFHEGMVVTVQDDMEHAIRYARRKTRGKDFFVQELYTPEEQAAAILS